MKCLVLAAIFTLGFVPAYACLPLPGSPDEEFDSFTLACTVKPKVLETKNLNCFDDACGLLLFERDLKAVKQEILKEGFPTESYNFNTLRPGKSVIANPEKLLYQSLPRFRDYTDYPLPDDERILIDPKGIHFRSGSFGDYMLAIGENPENQPYRQAYLSGLQNTCEEDLSAIIPVLRDLMDQSALNAGSLRIGDVGLPDPIKYNSSMLYYSRLEPYSEARVAELQAEQDKNPCNIIFWKREENWLFSGASMIMFLESPYCKTVSFSSCEVEAVPTRLGKFLHWIGVELHRLDSAWPDLEN